LLEDYSPPAPEFEARQLPPQELRTSMVLMEDVIGKDGKTLILREGTILSETWVERLENFSALRFNPNLVAVRVPRAPEWGGDRITPLHRDAA
jgi:hypothetical protein